MSQNELTDAIIACMIACMLGGSVGSAKKKKQMGLSNELTEPLGTDNTTLDCDNIQPSVDRAAADAFRGV